MSLYGWQKIEKIVCGTTRFTQAYAITFRQTFFSKKKLLDKLLPKQESLKAANKY